MFLAILISILVQMRGKESESQAEYPTVSASQLVHLEQKLHALEVERDQLTIVIQSLEKTLDDEEREAIDLLKKTESKAKERLKASEDERNRLTKELAVMTERAQELEDSTEQLDNSLASARKELGEKENELGEAISSRESKTSLPRVKSTRKSSLIFAMRYGKLYLVSDPFNRSSSSYYSPHVSSTTSILGDTITPRKNAGWNIEGKSDLRELESAISSHPSSKTFFSCAVWPDSHEQFKEFKKLMIERGYDYNLVPVDGVDFILVGQSSNASVQ